MIRAKTYKDYVKNALDKVVLFDTRFKDLIIEMVRITPSNRPNLQKSIERLTKILEDPKKSITKKFSLNEILPSRPKRITIKGGQLKENDLICAGCAKEAKEYCLELKLDFCLTCKKKYQTNAHVKTHSFVEKKPKEEMIMKCIECKKEGEIHCKECVNYYCETCSFNLHKFKIYQNHTLTKKERK